MTSRLARPRSARRALAFAAGVGALAGCDAAERGRPNPVPVSNLPVDAGAGGAGGGGASEPRLRTVGWRSPFGGPAGNLLLDGDFEFSAGAAGANLPGWLAFRAGAGSVDIAHETGGLCRSGLRCAVAERGVVFAGLGVAAQGTGLLAGLYAKVPAGTGCDVVSPALVEWSSGRGSYVPAVSDTPDAEGWCRYETAVGPQDTAQWLYVETDLAYGERALLDHATLLPDTGAHPLGSTAEPQSAAHRARAGAVLAWIRSRRPFGLGAPPWSAPGAPGPDSALARNRE